MIFTCSGQESGEPAGRAISGSTTEQSNKYIQGNDPVTGKPMMKELIAGLTEKPIEYEQGSWGPKEAERLVHPGGWHDSQGAR